MNRRELLRGTASGSALLLAFGCGGTRSTIRRREETRADVRTWLRDAVEQLAGTYPTVHALAVSRVRTTGALDVLGMGVHRSRRDGVVLSVRDATGRWREQVSSDLSSAGVAAAVRALGPGARKGLAPIPAPPALPVAAPLVDAQIRGRLERIAALDRTTDSRVIYAATLLDVDDATVWSFSPGHDRQQHNVRIRNRVLRAAWNGMRPVVCEGELAWSGGIDDQAFDAAAIARVTRTALHIMTPGPFEDREQIVVLDPSVTATLVDAGVRALLTSSAGRRPEVDNRLSIGASLAAPLFALVDDPTQQGAYGGFEFDDEGEVAAPQTLVDAGKGVGVLSDHAGGGRGRARRPGHVGPVAPASSHLRVTPGTASAESLRSDGLVLEGGITASVDPSSSRVVIVAARARELRKGQPSGRIFADVELVGDLRQVLQAIDGVASERAITAYRDDAGGEPTWRSIEAPWIRTKGFVRGRRST
ncbi:MAG: metallopeptidase TldD-related protein [Kofleriaceae bacterium]